MGRQIQPIRWVPGAAIAVALALAPQAIAGGLTGVPPAATGQVAASAAPATAAAQTTVAGTADAVVAAAPTALDAAGAAVEPAAQAAQVAAAGAQVAAATPVAATPAIAKRVVVERTVVERTVVKHAVVERAVAKRGVVKPAAERLSASQRTTTPRRAPGPRRQAARPGTRPSAHVRQIARHRAGDRPATTTIDRTPVLILLAPLAGPDDRAPAAPGAGGAAPVAAAPEPVRMPAIGGRTPLTTPALLFRSLTLLLRLERPD